MYFSKSVFYKLVTSIAVILLCSACNSGSNTVSGGGQNSNPANGGATLAVTETETEEVAPEIVQLAHAITVVIDDFGLTCPLQDSVSCGSHGGALVSAHNEFISGFACGSGSFPNEMVVNHQWVAC